MIIILIRTFDYDGCWYALKLEKQTSQETGWHLPSKIASCVNESLDTHPLALSAQVNASAGFSVGSILHIGDIGHGGSQHVAAFFLIGGIAKSSTIQPRVT